MSKEQDDFKKLLASKVPPCKVKEPTKQQLLDRGYCCKTGCKHCPWGFIGNTSG